MPRTYECEIQQRILERKKRAEQAREEQIRKRNQIFMIGGIALVVFNCSDNNYLKDCFRRK